jgi:putative membrane protein
MTLKSLLLAAAAVPLIGIGAVQAADNTGTTSSTSSKSSSMTDKAKDAVTPKKGAGDYVTKASIGDMFEIQSSQLAASRATNPAIKDFANMMVKDHTDSSQKVKDAAAKANIQPASALDKSHQKMLDDLKKASADKFDKMYLDDQGKAHREALSLHQKYAKSGDNADLKAAAAQIAPVVQSHIDHLKALRDTNRDKVAGTTKPKSALSGGSSSMGSSMGTSPAAPANNAAPAGNGAAPMNNSPPSALPQTR